jgi:isopenicillin N synthase-like dioxygenase
MLQFSHKLVQAFSIALGMGMHGLDSIFAEPTYFLRLQHYPGQEKNLSEDQFGIAPHTDAGFITILAQDKVGGLQIKSVDEQWIDVPYEPNTLVLNAGAMLPRLSNDIFRAIPHRVINKSHQERYSVPFFFDTNMHATIEVLKSCITSERPAKYPPIMYGEYLLDRIQGNYGVGKRRVRS